MKKTKVLVLLLGIVLLACSKRKHGYTCEGYNKSLQFVDVKEEHRDFEMTSKEVDESIQAFKDKYSSTHDCTCEKLTE